MIDRTNAAPGQGGRAGGNLQRDVGTADELAHVDDPEAHRRVTKRDDIENNDRVSKNRPRAAR